MYDWGRQGSQSEVANLMHEGNKQFVIDETKPYAELWMGVHPNGPSRLVSDGKLLSEKIAESESFLANHEDSNHKPEMAIALSNFQLLSGFRPFYEICDNIEAFPELRNLIISEDAIENLKTGNNFEKREALKKIFSEYMRSSDENVSKAVQQLAVRLKNKNDRSDLEELLLRLNSEYPGDVGVFAPLLINYFTLKKGDAVFMGPNSPHAYLLGDCVECMACSDNTVRAGLTSKFKDVNTLCSDLTFEMIQPPYFSPKIISPGIREYAPPVQEFAVHELGSDASELRNVGASSIIIVIKGSTDIHTDTEKFKMARGEVYFVPANMHSANIKPSGDFLAYRAFTPKR
ncbi:unnamed protein product [Acanthocheilonema viteae]|uniref:mannose-6-phosphate isomerase n=1 Tax=Acanthocheilonema viteae TaxID=6277 RepID=A0A498S529_ACAVI|nr:unnamed protein product [Acanthocheilonema viteae]